MSATPNDHPFSTLRDLPPYAPAGAVQAHIAQTARAAYIDHEARKERHFAFEAAWRVFVPVALAGTVGVYMTWALSVAVAVMR